ncbi:MAG: ATP-binding protein [Bacteroidales bacterium]|nr:ATP-binding protein [Bacteroidales bacterium]
MERQALEDLAAWKTSPDRKPLIIKGARQIGKTWLMKEFGRKCFKNTVYINFEYEKRFKDLFTEDFDTQRIVSTIELSYGKKINPKDTLIIFDEIQAVQGGLTSLKYFCENMRQYAVVAAGSLLGISLHENTSFPVGKVNFLDLHPMTFGEFLLASGKELLFNALKECKWDIIKPFHDELIRLVRTYMVTGGMPEVVQKWIDTQDFFAVRDKQRDILNSYQADFSKHIPDLQVPRVAMVWDSLPAQLSKENKKFIYGVLREGARAKDFELAIMWLINCGLILKSQRVGTPKMPLKAYQDAAVFKLYMVDCGLLCAATGLNFEILTEGGRIFTEFKGAITEQFVMQELAAATCDYTGYWTNERSTSEVDFIIQKNGIVIPIEVKAGENLQAKSFAFFCQKFQPEYAAKISALPYNKTGNVFNFPLYGFAEGIKNICGK